jgi:hypothetical protein
MFFFRNFTIARLLPRFLHIKPKAKPEEIAAFQTGNEFIEIFPDNSIEIFLVFPYGYYANITMGLNRTKTIPNSTDVWWEMSEQNNTYEYRPSLNCKKNQNDIFNRHFLRILSGSLSGQNYLTMMFFNDKVSPANISFLTRYG